VCVALATTKQDRENIMWDVELPVEGNCPECGEDLSTTVRIRSTTAWIDRYHADDRLHRGINHAVAQRVLQRHTTRCQADVRQRKVFAVTA
jgi:hypothetical protein